MTTFDKYDDIIQVCDITSRVEELEEQQEAYDEAGEANGDDSWAMAYPDEAGELQTLQTLLQELQGNGGDEQWRGDWYPQALIRDSHFQAHAQELAEDCSDIDFATLSWPLTCIDWDQAAKELRMDYSSVEFHGVTYWYR